MATMPTGCAVPCAVPVIPGRRNRKRPIRYDKQRYRSRHLIENAFCRIKDFRRVAARYDKLAAHFLSGVALAIALAFWLKITEYAGVGWPGMRIPLCSKIAPEAQACRSSDPLICHALKGS